MLEITKALLQTKIDNFMRRLGIQSHAIRAYVFEKAENNAPAYAKGGYFFGVPFGSVCVSKEITNYSLTENEFDFIIAHELSHILLNHFPCPLVLELPGMILDEINEDWAKCTKFSMDLVSLLRILNQDLPLKENIKKRREIEADMQAVYLTENKNAAITCLRKLSKTGKVSHHSKLLGVEVPYLFLSERISALERLRMP